MKPFHYFLFYILTITGIWHSCTQPFAQGKVLYEYNCSRCHGMDGNGFEDLYPGILNSPYLNDKNLNLACVIAYGSTYLDAQRGTSADVPMPENQQLSPVEILNIINYMAWEHGNGKQLKIDEVMWTLDNCTP